MFQCGEWELNIFKVKLSTRNILGAQRGHHRPGEAAIGRQQRLHPEHRLAVQQVDGPQHRQ